MTKDAPHRSSFAKDTIVAACMLVRTMAALLVIVLAAGSAFAIESATKSESATKEEALTMVKKAVAFIMERGPAEAYNEISKKPGIFTDRDLYVLVYRLDGTVLAHDSNAKLIGKDLSDLQDVDGK